MKVCFLTIDCLRFDTLNQENMPFLTEKSEEGISLTNYYSNAPFTPTAFPALFTGNYPLENERVLPIDREDSFVTDLEENGYKTIGISNNPYLSQYFNFDSGFDHFENHSMGRQVVENILSKKIRNNKLLSFIKEKIPFLSSKNSLNPTYGTADEITKRAIEKLKENSDKEKTFLWAHYMDLHDPYISKEEHRAEFGVDFSSKKIRQLNEIVANHRMNEEKLEEIDSKKIEKLRDLYKASAHFIDRAIERLWKKAGEDVIFIVTADHGEEFREHGNLGHLSKLYNEMLHVPFFIAGPGLEKMEELEKKIEEKLASSLDFYPTLLDLLDLKTEQQLKGRSLFSQKESDYIISESIHNKKRLPPHKLIYHGKKSKKDYRTYSYFDGEYKLIIDKQKENKLFNLNEDKKEVNNMINKKSEIKSFNDSILKSHIINEIDQLDL